MAFLEPGGVYAGANGQKREIIQIDSGWVTFRIVEEALHGRATRKKEGERFDVKIRTFRDWAQEEVA